MHYKILPDGVMVAQLILVQFVLVRVQVGQPFCLFPVLSHKLRLVQI